MSLPGCEECREWAALKVARGLPTAGDTYCSRCGAREADISPWYKGTSRVAGANTVARLSALPTLFPGEAADLKVNTGLIRVWLSRGDTPAIRIEKMRHGEWVDATPSLPHVAAVVAQLCLDRHPITQP